MHASITLHTKDHDEPRAEVMLAHDAVTGPYVRVRLDSNVTLYPSREYLDALIAVLTDALEQL